MSKKFKIERIYLNTETWYLVTETLTIKKSYLFVIWSVITLLFIKYSLFILAGYLLILVAPKFDLPIYRKVDKMWGIDNPTRVRSMCNNLIKIRKKQIELNSQK